MWDRDFFCVLRFSFLAVPLILASTGIRAQDQADFFNDSVTVSDCISYALKHQPLVNQLKIDELVADQTVRSTLSEWFPQISSGAGLTHYLKQPVIIFPNFSNPEGPKIEVTTGVKNSSSLQFSASQRIFDSDLWLAGRTAKDYRRQVRQSGQRDAIQLVVDINKAYYDVLLSRQMLNIINEDIDRLTVSLNDALALYKNGVRDKIDYSRATVSLNNARSQKISIANSIGAKLTYLKQLMGYPGGKELILKNSFNEMKNEIMADTLEALPYKKRIEYQLLETNISLQGSMVAYNRLGFLPSLSGSANFNYIFQNDDFSKLYNKSFPNSTVGLVLSFPIFEGGKRIHELKRSKLLYDRLVLDTISVRDEMYTGYAGALASYKNNLAAYNLTLKNIEIARDVYVTLLSQYREGVKPYLEVIISETDLRTAQLNNLSSLIMLMFSKIDVDQALGKISVGY